MWTYENGTNPEMYPVANDDVDNDDGGGDYDDGGGDYDDGGGDYDDGGGGGDDDDDDDDDERISLNLLGFGFLCFHRWLQLYCFNCHGKKSSTCKPQPLFQLTFTVHLRPMSCLLA